MNKINLHTHSKYSLDGTKNINDIINICFNNGIVYLAVTDHNNCDTYKDLDLNKIAKHGTLVYGMEADAIINNVTYDILCLGFEPSKVREWAHKQYGTILSRQTKIYNKLVEISNNLDLVLEGTNSCDLKREYAHAAFFRMLEARKENKLFLDKYNIKNVNDFYRLSTMDTEFPLYVDMSLIWPDILEVSQVIHESGGKVFLAHPYKYGKDKSVDEVLNSCKDYVDGIEISNESENEKQVIYLYNYAKRNDLLICAGSDFHDSQNHCNICVKYLNKQMVKDMEKWIDTVPGKVNI